MTGILIIATGNQYYGRMAYNLIASIKATENVPIALIYDAVALKSLEGNTLFDGVEMIRYEGQEHALRLKTRLYDLTPFDDTLFIDADTIWLKNKPSELFAELSQVDFTIANHGFADMATGKKLTGMNERNSMYWVDPSDLKEAYQLTAGKYYSLSTEVIWFKKSDKNHNYFEWVKDTWDAPLIAPREFAGSMPDEFAFSVASILQDNYPHKDMWRPSFWAYVNARNGYQDSDIWNNYYMYSAGGKVATARMRTFYNNRVKSVFKQMGLLHPFELRDKIKYLPERQKI